MIDFNGIFHKVYLNATVDVPPWAKEFAIEVLKYNLKQYKMYNAMVVINGGTPKTIDEITLETIKELKNETYNRTIEND